MPKIDKNDQKMPKIDKNSLNNAQKEILNKLLEMGQYHLFETSENQPLSQKSLSDLLNQAIFLNVNYPGGLEKYISHAIKLLQQSAKGQNPQSGFFPSVPNGVRLDFDSEEFNKAEKIGMEQVGNVAFVLVAGGLGERLGFDGIKLEMKCETATGKCFLELYAKHILAFQSRARKNGDQNLKIPLAIMTSDDTHEKTVALLKRNAFFGLCEKQIVLMKQDKVACFDNTKGKLSKTPNKKSPKILTKPHGHGDVHSLVLRSVLSDWEKREIKQIVFFQDTNLLAFRAIPALLGISAAKNYLANFLAVPRRSGEAVGSICKLEKEGKSVVCNVEYNQFESLMRDCGVVDEIDDNGFSSYPGNCNVFSVEFKTYAKILRETNGLMPEFINPKYADNSKHQFSSPVRMECMMSEYARLLPSTNSNVLVGFTQLPRWLCFSAAKNNLDAAIKRQKLTGFAESASSAEADFYSLNRRLLCACNNVQIAPAEEISFGGVKFEKGAVVVLEPAFGCTVAEIKAKVRGDVKMEANSALILDGDKIEIERLEMADNAIYVKQRGKGRVRLNVFEANNGVIEKGGAEWINLDRETVFNSGVFEKGDLEKMQNDADLKVRRFFIKIDKLRKIEHFENGEIIVQ